MEAPDLWEDVHVSLMTRIRAQLTQRLPEGFRARVEKWVRVEQEPERFRPDVAITTTHPTPTTGRIAVLERPHTEERTPPILVQAWQQEPLQRFIEIVAIGKPDRIITVIEILSHANKVGRGQEAYQHKQQLLVQSGTSLLEIDLLRAGSYTVAAPLTEEIPPLPYRVSLHRAGQLEQFEVWPISLRTPLPEVRIPLTPDRPDIYLDLQEALNEAYDEGNYAAEIDYTRPPIPALAPHDMSWMESFLTKA
ncbi:DUF4058 family protein [Armatimonas sp.]|uniref:DUF4058 family protein n=1 Tax=Armatimonas sp. TaxID=1872638 RepID=UPI00374D1FA7